MVCPVCVHVCLCNNDYLFIDVCSDPIGNCLPIFVNVECVCVGGGGGGGSKPIVYYCYCTGINWNIECFMFSISILKNV